MKRNTIIYALTIILLAVIVIAQVGGVNDRNLGLTSERRTALSNVGVTNYQTIDTIDGDMVRRCMLHEGFNINLCYEARLKEWKCTQNRTYTDPIGGDEVTECVSSSYVSRDTTEVRTELNNWEEKTIVRIADALIDRATASSRQVNATGTTTVTSR